MLLPSNARRPGFRPQLALLISFHRAVFTLTCVCDSNNLQATKFLLESKARVNATGYFATVYGPNHEYAKEPVYRSSELHYAALMCATDLLCAHSLGSICQKCSMQPCRNRENHEITNALIKAGANVNAEDDGGVTPLHTAVER